MLSASFCVFHAYFGFSCIYVMFHSFFLTNSVMSIFRDKFGGIFGDKYMGIGAA